MNYHLMKKNDQHTTIQREEKNVNSEYFVLAKAFNTVWLRLHSNSRHEEIN